MEKWNLGYEALKDLNKKLIMIRISGFGQSGPYKDKAGFGSVGEAMGGLRYVNGYPDLPPPRLGVSIGDSLAALFGAIGAMMALFNQVKHGDAEGQMIDVALYESVFAVMDNSIAEYYKYGIIKERTGSTLPKVAPSNLYETKEGKYVIIAANADNLFKRLAIAMNHDEWIEDPKFNTHEARGVNQKELDDLILNWTKGRNVVDILEIMDAHGIPAGPLYNMEDITKDKHYHDREMIQSVMDPDLGEVHMPGIVPKLSKTPGTIKWSGPSIGENNKDIYTKLLGLTKEEYETYLQIGVI
jgi:crotonobetainyl-CoA:carnitine CoA-transferase CaiB-like acyl-CoA transferase